MEYLKEWKEDSVKGGGEPEDVARRLLSQETQYGIAVTGNFFHIYFIEVIITFVVWSFVELVPFILKIPGVNFFLSERLSQDPLEKFFGCQRQRGHTNENPSCADFLKNTQALRVINSVVGHVPRGNCRGRKNDCTIEEENTPLPKRRRKH